MPHRLPEVRNLLRVDPGLFLPGVMALGVYPLLMALTDDPSAAFVTAFFMGLWVVLARHAEWAARYWCKRHSVRVASLLAVAAAMGPASVLMALGDPAWCLRLFTLFSVLSSMVILNDLRDGDHAFIRFRMPNVDTQGGEAELAQGFLIWNLCLIALNEAFVAGLSTSGMMVWYAILPIVAHVAESALMLVLLRRRQMMA